MAHLLIRRRRRLLKLMSRMWEIGCQH